MIWFLILCPLPNIGGEEEDDTEDNVDAEDAKDGDENKGERNTEDEDVLIFFKLLIIG